MADSIRITFRVLSTKKWTGSLSEDDAKRHSDIIDRLRPFVEPQPLLDLEQVDSLFQLFDEVFDFQASFAWNLISFSISLLELYVSTAATCDVDDKIRVYVLNLLDHTEARIRNQVSDLIKATSYRLYGQPLSGAGSNISHFHNDLASMVVQKILQTWTRSNTTREAILGDIQRIQLDDTTGWSHLESYLQALQALVIGISSHSVSEAVQFMHSIAVPSNLLMKNEGSTVELTPSDRMDGLVLLITLTSEHINRHVREVTYKFIAQLLGQRRNMTNLSTNQPSNLPGSYTQQSNKVADDAWYTVPGGEEAADRMVTAVLKGMQDDWSQIRLAATQACQAFLTSLMSAATTTANATTTSILKAAPITARTATSVDSVVHDSGSGTKNGNLLSKYWADLLPRLCMNRFYPAAAVQSVSHNTWRELLVPQGLGRRLLAQHAAEVATYYCNMTRARNHMTAEAACQAMAEFCEKIDISAVRHHVPLILETLCACLEDDRWPVRDAAIIASGIVVRYFPLEKITQESLPVLMAAWSSNLRDFIWSIREHAAIAFAEALQCQHLEGRGEEVAELRRTVLHTALQYIDDNLLYVLHQGATSTASTSTSLSTSDTTAVSGGAIKGVKNFLPDSLLQSDAAAKRRLVQQQQQVKHGPTDSASTTTDATFAAGTLPSSNITSADVTATSKGEAVNSGGEGEGSSGAKRSSKDRKGWGCCIDCIELRSCQPWEVSHGALYLLREVSAVQTETQCAVLFQKYGTKEGEEGNVDFSCTVDPKETYFGKIVYLLDTVQTSIVSRTAADAAPASSTSTGSGSNADSEHLLVAILEEVQYTVYSHLNNNLFIPLIYDFYLSTNLDSGPGVSGALVFDPERYAQQL